MKCTDKNCSSNKRFTLYARKLFSALFLTVLFLTGCGQDRFDMPYTADLEVSSFRIVTLEEERGTAVPFASDLCVVNSDITSSSVDMSKAQGAGLFDLHKHNTLYAKNVHERLYPASLTKMMTALVALKHSSGDMMLTASANVRILESGAQVSGIKEGDKMTLDQALHLLLLNSGNDAAIMVAEGVAGSVEAFVAMMNEEALALGATNTNFTNPHGLNDENHYTTVYDMYLIMNEAVNYSLFNEIISMDSYTTVYTDKNGASKEISVNNTNRYLQGEAVPEGLTVLGGKTGTTSAAGHCLSLITKDSSGNPYISIVMKAESGDLLYSQMTDLLEEINN